ncbi:hypothetical protein [Syntrophotalea acetylenica]|uniref:hypothetical protein n=1 Tax=Syntrophotalea acetylenica TaxID=29542 RepID=UPI001314C3D2|nr:hypothetical protein [Syntrophotalea acetylenica]
MGYKVRHINTKIAHQLYASGPLTLTTTCTYFLPPFLGLLAAWVSAEAATDLTDAGVFGFERSLPAFDATFEEVTSPFLPATLTTSFPETESLEYWLSVWYQLPRRLPKPLIKPNLTMLGKLQVLLPQPWSFFFNASTKPQYNGPVKHLAYNI